MSPTEPIQACTLGAGAQTQRIAEWRALVGEALISVAAQPNRFEARWRDGGKVREQLDSLVELERACCGFLTFTTRNRAEVVILEVIGPGADAIGSLLLDSPA